MATSDGRLDMDMLLRDMLKLQNENEELRMKLEVTSLQKQIDGLQMQSKNMKQEDTVWHSESKTSFKTPDRTEPCRTPGLQHKSACKEEEDEIGLLPEDNITFRQRPKRSTLVKAATYDGSNSWLDYKAHFETCAEINNWSYTDKGLYLAVALRGQAQGVFGNLTSKSRDYDSLLIVLEERFAPPNQTELYRVQLRERRQKASDTLSELGQDIRRLTNLAYPTAPVDVRETLAKEQFIDSLVSMDMRLRVKQARPTSLNDAVRHAVELEAFNRAEKSKLESQGIFNTAPYCPQNEPYSKPQQSELQQLISTVARLGNELCSLKEEITSRSNNESPDRNSCSGRQYNVNRQAKRRCFECGSKYHMRPSCPNLKEDKPVERTNKQSENYSKTDNETLENANAVGSGLYLKVKLGDQILNCLVDTGASVTVLSNQIWQNLDLGKRNILTSYDRTIATASGEPLTVLGTTKLTIQIGNENYEANVLVADIENDLLMGLDFLQTHGCTIDVVGNAIFMRETKYHLNCKGLIGCYKVKASEDVDYVLSLVSPKMPKTNLTPWKPILICPSCEISLTDQKSYKFHLLTCVAKQLGCPHCNKTFSKQAYFKKHMQNVHNEEENATAGPSNDTDEGWDVDPAIELGDEQESDIYLGRTKRKSTNPIPVIAPLKKINILADIVQHDGEVKVPEQDGEEKLQEHDAEEKVSEHDNNNNQEPQAVEAKDKVPPTPRTGLTGQLDIVCKSSSEERKVCVKDNEGELYSTSSKSRVGRPMGKLSLNIGDFLKDPVDPSDIDVVLNQNGELMVQIKY